MMRLFVLMIGPTAMILLGLQGLNSMLYTFALFYGWLLLIPLADGLLQKKSTLSENLKQLGFRVHKKNLKYGLILGIVLLVVIPMTVALLRPLLFDVTELKPLLQAWGFSRHAVWYIVILVVVNPLLEEIYWRCYMYRKLEKKAACRIGDRSHLDFLQPVPFAVVSPDVRMALRCAGRSSGVHGRSIMGLDVSKAAVAARRLHQSRFGGRRYRSGLFDLFAVIYARQRRRQILD